jgi:prepilin-type N-terminal cleavage/methylation domain-containing protein
MRSKRKGMTLVELLVVLAILALMGGVAALSFRSADIAQAPSDGDRIAAARHTAIVLGHPVHFLLLDSATVSAAEALPDGRVLLMRTSITHDSETSSNGTR